MSTCGLASAGDGGGGGDRHLQGIEFHLYGNLKFCPEMHFFQRSLCDDLDR